MSSYSRPQNKGGPQRRGRQQRRRACYFTTNKIEHIDYKDVPLLKQFVGESGRITSRRFTATKTHHQRKLAVAIKRARFLALLPYTDKHSLQNTN